MYVRRLASDSTISYFDFVNTPGFLIQAGKGINFFKFSGDGAQLLLPISDNFPGITPGDPFTVVVGADEAWTTNSPVTHHGYTYGNAGSHVLVNGGGRKRWFTRTSYDGGNTVTVDGFYSGDSTNFPYARMYLLAVRFRVNQTGYAAGDGNGVVGGQTGLTINTYVNNFPFNTNIQHTLVVPPAPEPPDPGTFDPGCFPLDAQVLMHDYTLKPLGEIQVGDRLIGGHGYVNTVLALEPAELGHNVIYGINQNHFTTSNHRHLTTQGWASLNPTNTQSEHEQWFPVIVDNQGTQQMRQLVKFYNTPVHKLTTQSVLDGVPGAVPVTQITEHRDWDPATPVRSLIMDGSHTFVVNGYIVSGWATDLDFDYTTWQPKT
jgi:hypothetical protein